MISPRILFFGDLTETDFGVEELVGYAEKSERLAAYFDDALVVSQKTLSSLSLNDLSTFPLDSLAKLASRVQQDESSSVVLRALALCFAQIGHLIAELEKNPALQDLWIKQKVLIVASCAGQLAGSLAATARSIDDLVKAGPEMLAVMIRAAFDADRKTDAVIDDRSKSCAYAVFEISVSQAVGAADQFNKEKV
ncbi:polyketide synthase [Fusarium albosuccineum]|uniref:Polyketide synthase n=1 Tax=Fusarium albosuccineum TaxID=1237068 RepID=A0A8H4L909_9HYPO|nr:polyketide synthase [Fusarium albosuccineum]